MKPIHSVVFLLLISSCCVAQKTKEEVIKSIDSKSDKYSTTAKKIWDFAEVGFQETQSSNLLQQTLKDAGFKVESDVAGMPTAFVASYGSGKPVIGILAEFDALPGVAQEAVPELKPIAK
jgi:aminobenzoyl-glutamate utilization protein B